MITPPPNERVKLGASIDVINRTTDISALLIDTSEERVNTDTNNYNAPVATSNSPTRGRVKIPH